MDKIEQLYNLYLDKNLITKAVSLEQFRNSNPEQQVKLYNLGKKYDLFQTTGVEKFQTAWTGVKKKDVSEPISPKEDTDVLIEDVQENIGTLESSEEPLSFRERFEKNSVLNQFRNPEEIQVPLSPTNQPVSTEAKETIQEGIETVGFERQTPVMEAEDERSVDISTLRSDIPPRPTDLMGARMWDQKYGAEVVRQKGVGRQVEENIRGLIEARNAEINAYGGEITPKKRAEIEQRYRELIDKEAVRAPEVAAQLIQEETVVTPTDTYGRQEIDEEVEVEIGEEGVTPTFQLDERDQEYVGYEREMRGLKQKLEETEDVAEREAIQRDIDALEKRYGRVERVIEDQYAFDMAGVGIGKRDDIVVEKKSEFDIEKELDAYSNLSQADATKLLSKDTSEEELSKVRALQTFTKEVLADETLGNTDKLKKLDEEYARLEDTFRKYKQERDLDYQAGIRGLSKEQYIRSQKKEVADRYAPNLYGDQAGVVIETFDNTTAIKDFLDEYYDPSGQTGFMQDEQGNVILSENISPVEQRYIQSTLSKLTNKYNTDRDKRYAEFSDEIASTRREFGRVSEALSAAKSKLETLRKDSLDYKVLESKIRPLQKRYDNLERVIGVKERERNNIFRDDPIEAVENLKQEFDNSESLRAAFTSDVPGLTSLERFERAYLRLKEDNEKLAKEEGINQDLMTRFGRNLREFLDWESFGVTLTDKEKEYLANRRALIALTPLFLNNQLGTTGEDAGFWDAFMSGAAGMVAPEGTSFRTQTDVLDTTIEQLQTLGFGPEDFNDPEIIKKMEETMDTDLFSMEFAGSTLGVVTPIIATLFLTKKGVTRPGVSVAQKSKNIKKFADTYNKTLDATKFGKFMKPVLAGAADFEVAGRIFGSTEEELNFESGLLGMVAGEGFKAALKKIPVSKLVEVIGAKFGNNTKEAVAVIEKLGRKIKRGGELVGRSAGEVAEETTQELTQIYKRTLEEGDFFEELEKQFGTMNDIMKFVVSSAVMGLAMGTSEPSRVKSAYDNLSDREKKIVDEVKSAIEKEHKNAVDKASKEVTEEDIIVTDPTKGYTFEYTSEEDIPTELQGIKPLGRTEITKGKTKKDATKSIRITFSGQQLLDAGIAKTSPEVLTKTKEDAISKQETDAVDEDKQTGDLQAVVEGDTESIITTGEGKTEAEIEKGVQETPTEILKTEVVEEFVDLTPKQKTAYKREAKKRMVANKQKTSKASVQKFAEGLHQKEVLIKKEASDLMEILNNDATVQLQLDGKTVSQEKMNSLVKAAQAKMNEKLPELEEKAEVVDEPAPANVIPITITENTELANKVKKMGLKELVGKKINLVMADQLKVDEKALDEEGKPKQMGGPFFPLMDALFGKVAWASIDKTAANKIIDGAIKGDYTVVFNMKPSALDSNTVNLNTLIEKVKTADNSVEIFEAMKEDVLGKKIKTNKKIQESKNIDEFAEGFAELGVDDRAKIFKAVLPSADVKADTKVGKLFQDKGISQESIRQENVEQFVSDLPMGAITTVLQITDKKGNPITKATRSEALITPEQQKAEGLPSHTNYPMYIRGKAIGIMKETVPFWNLNKNYKNTIDLKTAGLIKKRETYKVDIDGEERIVKVSNNPNKTRTVTLMKKGETNKEESSEVIPKSTKTKTTTLITKKFGDIKEAKDIDKKITAKEARSNVYRSATMKASAAFEVTEPTAVQYTQFVRKLSKAFPSVEIVATEKEFDALLKDLNAKALSTKNQKIYGAVYEGKLFLNPALENFNTPVHEFGHIWLNTVKEGRPELYKKGMELVENSDYIQQIKDNADYQRVIKKMRKDGSTEEEINEYIREEALATAIGDQGEAFATAAQQRSFKTWLKDLFDYVKKLVGISKVTAEQLQNMTFEEFVESVAVDLLSENELFVEAEVKSFSDALQLMSTPSSNTIDQIIKIGRDNNYSDEAIIEVLKEKKFKLKDINEAMEVVLSNQYLVFKSDTLPKEFRGIEGGLAMANKLYQDTMEKISKFAIQGPRGGKGRPGVRTKTDNEIQVKALEIIKENPIYKKQSNETQQKIILGFQNNLKQNLGVRFREKSVRKELENIKRNLKQIKITDKTIRTKQRELRQFIRASLPKDLGYTVAQINSLIKDVETTTPANFAVKVDKIIEKVKKQEEKIKTKLIESIVSFVAKKSKLTPSKSKKTRSPGTLDAEGIQFFKDMKPILNAILNGDIDKIAKVKENLLDKQAEIDAIVLKTKPTVKEQELFNTMVSIDLLEGIKDKSLEEVKEIFKTLQEGAQASREQLKVDREVKAERRRKISEEATEQIKETNPELYENGKLLSKAEFNQKRKEIYKAFRKGNFVKGWKQFKELHNYTDIASKIKSVKNSFKHLGTLTNMLDNKAKGLNIFTDVVYRRLNRANEQELKGTYETRAKIDDIAKRAGVENGYDGIKRLLFKGKKKSYSFRVKNTKTENEKDIDFTADELMRIYALSLNDIQRAKLENMLIGDKEIAEIKEILGKELVDFTDGLVDFLSDSYYESVNAVFSSVNNINLGRIDNYFPTRTVTSDATKDMIKEGEFNSIFQAETSPAFKQRLDRESDIDLEGSDFTQTLENHIMTMEKYKAYAIPVSDINVFMKNEDVANLLDKLRAKKLMNVTVNNAVNPYALSKSMEDNKFINWLQRRFMGFALAFKIIQIPKQATSFVNAYEDYSFFKKDSNVPAAVRTLIDPLMFTVDVASTYAGVTKDIIGMIVPGVKGPIRKAMDVSATFRDRVEKGMKGDIYALESGQRLFKPVSQKMSRAGIIGRGFKTAAGLPTSIGDILGVMGYMVNFNRDIKNGMPLDEAVEKLNNYNATQQTRRGTEKTPIQLQKNYLTRTFTMFGSVVFLQINKVMSSMTNIMRSIQAGQKPKRKDIRSFYLNAAIANALFVGASNLAKLLMGDDEDQEAYWDEVKKTLMLSNLFHQIPLTGMALEEWDVFDRIIMGLDSEREYKKGLSFGGRIINPFLSVGYKVKKDIKKYGFWMGSIKPVTEMILGTQLDPFIGLFNLGVGSDTQDFEESMYDALGISKSYRPGAGKKSGGKKEEEEEKSVL